MLIEFMDTPGMDTKAQVTFLFKIQVACDWSALFSFQNKWRGQSNHNVGVGIGKIDFRQSRFIWSISFVFYWYYWKRQGERIISRAWWNGWRWQVKGFLMSCSESQDSLSDDDDEEEEHAPRWVE